MCKWLLEHGADPLIRDCQAYRRSWRPLDYAVWNGHLSIVELLLDHSPDQIFVGDWRWQPLHYAVYMSDVEMTSLLLERNAPPHKLVLNEQKYCLDLASKEEIVEMLLRRGAWLADCTENTQTKWRHVKERINQEKRRALASGLEVH
eukprot:TRINITY_DN10488_c0_g2_i3.p1 TRINITY_DN10488_c0_g2~~TRINITY_DN10488_c0_g2_i3.p1  ORF type:complete len:147 (-),score=21.58 TRINITY_DN10488_c0_g2_i3:141-581(-)